MGRESKIKTSEAIILAKNFNCMLTILNQNIYTLTAKGMDNESIDRDLPSTKTLYSIQNGEPVSLGSVRKLVQFWNKNISPEIRYDDLLNDELSTKDYKKIVQISLSPDKVCGAYECYYISDSSKKLFVHGGYLFIFKSGATLTARIILGIAEKDTFSKEEIEEIFDNNKTSKEAKRKFNLIRRSTEKAVHTYFSEGPVTILPNSIIIDVINQNITTHRTYISFPYSNHIVGNYKGGLGYYFSPAFKDEPLRICKLAIRRISKESYHLELDNNSFLDILKVQPTGHCRVKISSQDEDYRAWEEILNRIS